jgi:hypothetical protein
MKVLGIIRRMYYRDRLRHRRIEVAGRGQTITHGRLATMRRTRSTPVSRAQYH